MNKFVKNFLIVIVTLFLIFIASYAILSYIEKPPVVETVSDESYCSDLKWRKVKKGYDSKTVIELASKLESTAKLDANSLDSSAINFRTGLEKIISSSSNQEFEVSEELYDNLISYCIQITVISRLIKDGTFGDDVELLNEVRKELLRISVSFGQIKGKEKNNKQNSKTSNQSNQKKKNEQLTEQATKIDSCLVTGYVKLKADNSVVENATVTISSIYHSKSKVDGSFSIFVPSALKDSGLLPITAVKGNLTANVTKRICDGNSKIIKMD